MGVVIELSQAEMPRFLPPPQFSVPFVSPSLRWGRKKRLRCFNAASAALRFSSSPSPELGCPLDLGDAGAPRKRGEPVSTARPLPNSPVRRVSSPSPPLPPPPDRPRPLNPLAWFPSPAKDESEGGAPLPPPVLPDLASGAPTKTVEARVEECPPGASEVGWSLRSRAPGCGEEKGKRKQRTELWVSLSKDEIEEDFLWMTGAKPPCRSRRRGKAMSDQLKGVFPGSWLPSKITANRYKVSEPPDPRKG